MHSRTQAAILDPLPSAFTPACFPILDGNVCVISRVSGLCLSYVWPFFSQTTWVSQYQKGKTNLDFTEARDSEWQWHQLGRMQVCPRSRQITTPTFHHSIFLQVRCPFCCPTNSIKALNDQYLQYLL